MHQVGLVVEIVLYVFIALMFVRMIASFVQSFARSWAPSGVILVLLEGVYSVTDLAIKPMRRLVPPLRLGGVALDLAFILVFIIAQVLRSLNQAFLVNG